MTPPECDTTPRRVETVGWPGYQQLEFLASREACIYQTAWNAWDSVPMVGVARLTNLSDDVLTVSFVEGTVVRPTAIWDAEFPEQVLDWSRLRTGTGGVPVTVGIAPGETREFGPSRLLHSALSSRLTEGVSLGRPPVRVSYRDPRPFVCEAEVVIRIGDATSLDVLRRTFRTTFSIRYLPLPDEE